MAMLTYAQSRSSSCRHTHTQLCPMKHVTVQVVERLEAVLQLQRYMQLDGLQLERDVRMLTGALGKVMQRKVRNKVACLAQMLSCCL